MEPEKAADLVRKLRAKAASTTFPEEAKLLSQKADKLARRYKIREWAAPPPPRRAWTPPPPPRRRRFQSLRPRNAVIRLVPETRPNAGSRDAYCDENGNLFGG